MKTMKFKPIIKEKNSMIIRLFSIRIFNLRNFLSKITQMVIFCKYESIKNQFIIKPHLSKIKNSNRAFETIKIHFLADNNISQ